MHEPVRIVGIGSGLGADQAGWLAVRALEENGFVKQFPDGLVASACCLDPSALPSLMLGAELLIVVDGLAADTEPGSVRRIDVHELADSPWLASSHGVSLTEALALVQALGDYPRLAIFGLSVDRLDAHPLYEPRAEVEAAVPTLCRALAQEINESMKASKIPSLKSPTNRRPQS